MSAESRGRSEEPESLEALLRRVRDGDEEARDELFSCLFGEIRAIARLLMRSERRDHTLQPTALAQEAYVCLFKEKPPDVIDIGHLLALFRRVMKHLLITHGRRHSKERSVLEKHLRSRLPGIGVAQPDDDLDERTDAVIAALAHLREGHPDHAEAIELRLFADLSTLEISFAQNVTENVVRARLKLGMAKIRDFAQWRSGQSGRADERP